MHRLFSLLVLAVTAIPASACINGWDTPIEEQEFRSQYGSKAASTSGYSPSNGLLIGLGAVGLVAAGAFALTTGRTRA